MTGSSPNASSRRGARSATRAWEAAKASGERGFRPPPRKAIGAAAPRRPRPPPSPQKKDKKQKRRIPGQTEAPEWKRKHEMNEQPRQNDDAPASRASETCPFDPRNVESLLEFPQTFPVKIFLRREPEDTVERLRELMLAHLRERVEKVDAREFASRSSAQSRYLCFTVGFYVESKPHLDSIYLALGEFDRVKMLL